MQVFGRIKGWSDSRGISKQAPSENKWDILIAHFEIFERILVNNKTTGYIPNKVEELREYCEAQRDGDRNGVIDAIADSMIFDATELIKEQCDIELTLNEVLLVLESRKGTWDESVGKFIKDKSEEAQALWYVPNYIDNARSTCPKSYISDLFKNIQGGK